MSAGLPSRSSDRRQLREERRRRRRRVVWISAAAAAALVLLVGGGVTAAVLMNQGDGEPETTASTPKPAEPVVFEDDVPATAQGAEPCTQVKVLASLENSEMVTKLAEGYNAQPRDIDRNRVHGVVTKDKSGLAVEDAAANFKNLPEDERPIVW